MEEVIAHPVTVSTHVADLLLDLLERSLTWLLASGVRIRVVLARDGHRSRLTASHRPPQRSSRSTCRQAW
ncbi:MAG: hypothetical protein HYY35_07930 [Deltaproteobacteria bacterium]|nr:hypothetical protein [Deltaproteobacteria bacterium]